MQAQTQTTIESPKMTWRDHVERAILITIGLMIFGGIVVLVMVGQS